MPSPTPTPYAVRCPTHGQAFLTKEEYDAQMMRPDARWSCPICGLESSWDDDNYEKAMDEIYGEYGDDARDEDESEHKN